jgi:hypothetical protein
MSRQEDYNKKLEKLDKIVENSSRRINDLLVRLDGMIPNKLRRDVDFLASALLEWHKYGELSPQSRARLKEIIKNTPEDYGV